MYQTDVTQLLLKKGRDTNSSHDFLKKNVLSKVKRYFTITIRVIEYSYRMESASN